MGKKGCIAMLIFATSHIALILTAICLSTHKWIQAKPQLDNRTADGSNVVKNTTEFTYSKGLWQYCRENKTTVYYQVPQNHKNENQTVLYNKTIIESEHCDSFWGELQPDNMTATNETSVFFYITKYAYTDGVVALCLGIILLYVYICTSQRSLCGSLCKAVFCFLCLTCAGALLFVALVIHGQHYSNDRDFSNLIDYDLFLGWSFYVGMAGNVFCLLSAFLSIFLIKYERLQETPYENVYVNF